LEWVKWVNSQVGNEWTPNKDGFITLANIEDIAKITLERVQTGWFGKYHVTPNDHILLSDVIKAPWNERRKIPFWDLQSRYNWKMEPTKAIWDRLVAACAA
jgi:hypothetical protein